MLSVRTELVRLRDMKRSASLSLHAYDIELVLSSDLLVNSTARQPDGHDMSSSWCHTSTFMPCMVLSTNKAMILNAAACSSRLVK